MATTISTSWNGTGTYLDVNDNEHYIVAAGVGLVTTGPVVFWMLGERLRFDIEGQIIGGRGISTGLAYSAYQTIVNVGVDGVVIGFDDYAISLSTTLITINNDGWIWGAESGINLFRDFSYVEDPTVITNTGTVAGLEVGIRITGANLNTFEIYNTGVIEGNLYSIQSRFYGVERVINSGVLKGDVDLHIQDDYYDGRLGTIVGTVYGGDGNDELLGGAGAETFYGGADNDILDGGGGADTLIGGTGNDTYYVDNTGDVVTENTGEGTDTVNAAISYALTDNVETLILTGAGNINGTGNAADNTLSGNSGNNVLNGGVGADTMTGGAGNDTYYVDNAGDVVVEAASGGTDTVRSSVSYTLGGNVEKLILTGTGNLSGTGNSLSNTLSGNSGNNTLNGSSGNDTLSGGSGNDRLLGGSGNDNLLGGSGNDRMEGSSGNDKLTGDSGADILFGGSGADRFIFKALSDSTVSSSGRDVIEDFSRGQGDRIDLSAIDASTKSSGNQAFSFIGEKSYSGKAGELRYVNKDGDTFIYGDVNGDRSSDFSIRIDANIDLVKGDFIL